MNQAAPIGAARLGGIIRKECCNQSKVDNRFLKRINLPSIFPIALLTQSEIRGTSANKSSPIGTFASASEICFDFASVYSIKSHFQNKGYRAKDFHLCSAYVCARAALPLQFGVGMYSTDSQSDSADISVFNEFRHR